MRKRAGGESWEGVVAVREYSTALDLEVPTSGNLTDDVVRNGTDHADDIVLSRRAGDRGEWQHVTAAEFLTEVGDVARGLIAAGIEPGDRVALLSRTRYEWTLLDYAIWFAGGVTVPVYDTSSAEQVAWLLSDSGARAVLVETDEHASRVGSVRGDLPDLHHVWTIDRDAVGLLRRLGGDVSDADLEQRRTTAGPDDLATLLYTSGTTGRPKGCMITHGHLGFELTVALAQLHQLFTPVSREDHDQQPGSREGDLDSAPATLLFLPMPHVFARVIQVGAIRARVRLGHSADVRRLVPDLEQFSPSFVLAVPRIFEKVFNTASQQAVADGRGSAFGRAVDTAIAWSRAQDSGRVPVRLRVRHQLYDRLVYARLRRSLGGRCRYAVSGGAPLGERLGHFYRGIGLTVLEGYGLTETTAAVTVNDPEVQKVGTVGRPLPGTAVRVADDGELIVRGGQVFAGYWGDAEATAEVLDAHGWLATGDLGEIDDEGFVRLTGRKKEILVTAGGKNVAPATIEDLLRAHPLIDQALVVGDGRPFVAALLTLDEEALPAWAERHGTSARARDVLHHPDLRAELQAAVDEANTAVSRAESVRAFEVVPGAWTEEGGQLTPSLKLRRQVVVAQHRDEIDALYAR